MQTEPTAITTIDTEETAATATAEGRINIPINLHAWRDRPATEQDLLLWFHQHILDEGLTWREAQEAIGYDRTTVFRILKGTYKAESWDKAIRSIESYRKIATARGTITRAEFVPNGISRMVHAGLDYAVANNSITTIIGESRQGKTIAARAWATENNHGRTVLVTAPPVGGTKMLLRVIAAKCGINRTQSIVALAEGLHRAFNRNRILIIDEAHRLIPSDSRTLNPASLELLRDLHDQTGCALAFIATARFSERIKTGSYQFEQLIGRIGMPIRLPKTVSKKDVHPIITQYIPEPTPALLDTLITIANAPGRLGILSETLKVASRIAAKAKQPLTETHITRAVQVRKEMSGEA